MSATLGGLIKDFRLQKDLSQLEIAFALGWKEPSRLSRIEQGRVGNPKRKLLNRLMDAMKLTDEERNRLMLVGNYVPTTPEISKAVRKVAPIISKWQYPVVVYDYLWRIVDENAHATALFQTEELLGKTVAKDHPHVLELIFDPGFTQNKHLNGPAAEAWQSALSHMLVLFRHAHMAHTKEKWFMELVARMMNNTSFRELWNNSQDVPLKDVVVHYMPKTIVDPASPQTTLSFNVFLVPVREDARFTIEFFTPADMTTMQHYA